VRNFYSLFHFHDPLIRLQKNKKRMYMMKDLLGIGWGIVEIESEDNLSLRYIKHQTSFYIRKLILAILCATLFFLFSSKSML